MTRKTRTEAAEQRDKLLSSSRLSREEMRDRSEMHTLSMKELMTWRTIESLDYLLGDEST